MLYFTGQIHVLLSPSLCYTHVLHILHYSILDEYYRITSDLEGLSLDNKDNKVE